MNSNKQNIAKLQKMIFDALDPLIDGNYSLLDIPDHVNIGDQLIAGGEFAYLNRLKHKMNYTSNDRLFQFNKVKKNDIILFHGGGNFGDIWRGFQEFRIEVIQRFHNQRIIIFPQTVHYRDESTLMQDAQVFNRHKDLTICTRDLKSYDLLKKYFVNNRILLLPDMAFCMNLDAHIKRANTGKALILKRVDMEISRNFDAAAITEKISPIKKVEIKDWPSIRKGTLQGKIQGQLHKLNQISAKAFVNTPLVKKFVDHRYGFLGSNLLESYKMQGINFINEYDEIYTTRLHGFILSVLLDKKVYMLDNSYGKNSTFFNAWMGDFKNTFLI